MVLGASSLPALLALLKAPVHGRFRLNIDLIAWSFTVRGFVYTHWSSFLNNFGYYCRLIASEFILVVADVSSSNLINW